ncbi:XRE family transcriptional regulator [Thermosipho melanesiensis]|uniref:Transcriptional regulator, XRE family n=2 Tax=Thermosipho melanesiensis TaxID=46541 RepID=A6LN24_THEM4|nr:helix-turn-helix transcriptional regulator [Thermosipho melanesiensis]ABR31325.1 transcriptional regulator, XRE family [Thermosipho melanesiensis BI429]APT74390.1 XRE family transcriptional regulator [Thermosipho melanesiensis]OOC36349.1 XRE family transcriptional regulator [Thermosipho melanesiensis]OOC37167.1 XRE family transcriptional regulator [Thermosipho melanesiensis]OOC37919.1 XRE family transcriptional regulator [Thermosipho melanesiensis]
MTLRELREKKMLTQQQLAKLIGVTQRTISAYEIGQAKPSLDVAIRLAKALGVSVEDVFEAWVEGKSSQSPSE